MADFGAVLTYVLELFQMEFTIWGFTLTLWQILAFTTVTPIVAATIGGLMSGGD